MTYKEFLTEGTRRGDTTIFPAGKFRVECPDGEAHSIWAYNHLTGDLLITGYNRDAFIDASNPENVGVGFE